MVTRALSCAAALLIASSVASAQDRPVVFVHGLLSSPQTWTAAAARLQAELALTPYVPSVPWHDSFDTQASSLQAQLASLPASTIAVGHSNGGIVSRQWSTLRPLTGVITIGSPQQGAPIVSNVLAALGFHEELYNVVGWVFSAFGAQPDEFWDAYVWVELALRIAQGISWNNFWTIAGLGVASNYPVLGQMAPGSPFIQHLNSSANLLREASAIPQRVGVAYVLYRYWQLGVLRLTDHYAADYWYPRVQWGIFAMEYVASYLMHNYPSSGRAWNIANLLLRTASLLRSLDPAWCWAVTNDASCNTPHDGVVPSWSQIYPNASHNFVVHGPAHTQETSSSDTVIAHALTTHMGVAARRSAVPPPAGAPAPDVLQPGEQLSAGQSRLSSNGQYELSYQRDGNLVLYRVSDGHALWATHTVDPGVVEMQHDGNVVIYGSKGGAIWWTGTVGFAGARLVVQNDSNLVLYDYYGYPRWSRY